MALTFYSRNGDFVEITVRDQTGKKLESFKCSSNNKTAYNKILSRLKSKYNFVPEIKSLKKAEVKDFKEQEVDFLDMKNNWFS